MTDLLKNFFLQPFVQRAMLAALLASVVCGVLGTYVVARRASYMVGAVSHSLLGGIGLARWCQAVLGMAFFSPMAGAFLAASVSSVALTFLGRHRNFREDAVLSGIWTVGVAAGLCFIARIPGYAEDLNGYLFGNILLIGVGELRWMALAAAIVLPLVCLFHNRFLALCFHEEGLALRGVSPVATALLLNVLIGFAVVLLAQTVGLLMALAMMVLPAASASRIARRMPSIMILAALFCLVCSTAGMVASYLTDLPAGALTILAGAGLHAAVCLGRFLAAWHRRE